MKQQELIPHLFRTEYSKIVAVLCKQFGFDQVETAEDIASETFMAAAQCWGLEGIPPNPPAWLYHVAKNKAKNYLQRVALFKDRIVPELTHMSDRFDKVEIDLSLQNIKDSQLQMMFAVCHHSISAEAQIALSLRLLCGFGIEEIAIAFLTNKETINKRLFRAKEKLRKEPVSFEVPPAHVIDERLDTVLTTIYLLFSEGYYSVSQNQTIRKDLCVEAMRLCQMLIENRDTDKPQVSALFSLMCFQASRFEARMNQHGEMIFYAEQDTHLWNQELISRGAYYLHRSATGSTLSKYHLEAAIAYWNTQHSDRKEKWEKILQLYNQLLQLVYSPIAALNRAYALSKVNGKQEAIREAEKLKLVHNQFYFMLLGELYTGIDNQTAEQHFQMAFSLARTQADKQAIERKLAQFSL